MDPLEYIWDNILSRSPERIRKVFTQLDEASQREVIAHLQKMISESGWHTEQVVSAKAALDALADQKPNSSSSN